MLISDILKLAFGTGTAWFKDVDDTTFNPDLVAIIKMAIQKGFYHHLDCAEMYGTEEEIGIAIKESVYLSRSCLSPTKSLKALSISLQPWSKAPARCSWNTLSCE